MARDEQIELLSLCAVDGISGTRWQLIAREALHHGLSGLQAGLIREQSRTGRDVSRILASDPDHDAARDRVIDAISRAEESGARLMTVLDDDYPLNLREIHDLPPFLFYRGELRSDDARALAVVGTRKASQEGLELAHKVAYELATRSVTVVSGLARGIDTVAHQAALEAGGRTIAVLGTGILRTYPKENADLAAEIAETGAVVSQFWPDQPPGRHTFPIRNGVTSGMSQGTIVIEASATSGAKNQARQAHEHGKRVFLVERLVTTQEWAEDFVAEGKATMVSNLQDITSQLRDPDPAVGMPAQLELRVV